ncbi:MAG: hypothetical protein NT169_21415 [Chloroflexi bacterium]|nr:hypothetical protein [Chloroflexota bacterium]
MLLLIQIWVAVAMLAWGALAILSGAGTYSLSKSWFFSNANVGDIAPVPALFGLSFLLTGLATFGTAIGLGPLRDTFPMLALGAVFIFGVQLATGCARLESNSTLTLLRKPNERKGRLSRAIGAIIAAAALVMLVGSLQPFGVSMSPRLVSSVVSVCATLFAAILVNVLTGGVIASDSAWKWLPTAAGVITVVLIVSQTPLWPLNAGVAVEPPRVPVVTAPGGVPAAATSRAVQIIAGKQRLHVGEQTILTVTVDPSIPAPTFIWSTVSGIVPGDWLETTSVTYTAPSVPLKDFVTVIVRDRNGREVARNEIEIEILR